MTTSAIPAKLSVGRIQYSRWQILHSILCHSARQGLKTRSQSLRGTRSTADDSHRGQGLLRFITDLIYCNLEMWPRSLATASSTALLAAAMFIDNPRGQNPVRPLFRCVASNASQYLVALTCGPNAARHSPHNKLTGNRAIGRSEAVWSAIRRSARKLMMRQRKEWCPPYTYSLERDCWEFCSKLLTP